MVSTDFGEENIPGVDFDLFDVTEVYYDLIRDNPLTPEREDGLNSAEAIEWIQNGTQKVGFKISTDKY